MLNIIVIGYTTELDKKLLIKLDVWKLRVQFFSYSNSICTIIDMYVVVIQSAKILALPRYVRICTMYIHICKYYKYTIGVFKFMPCNFSTNVFLEVLVLFSVWESCRRHAEIDESHVMTIVNLRKNLGDVPDLL